MKKLLAASAVALLVAMPGAQARSTSVGGPTVAPTESLSGAKMMHHGKTMKHKKHMRHKKMMRKKHKMMHRM